MEKMTKEIKIKINLTKNDLTDFSVNCKNSCSLAENASVNSTFVQLIVNDKIQMI